MTRRLGLGLLAATGTEIGRAVDVSGLATRMTTVAENIDCTAAGPIMAWRRLTR